MSDICAVPGVTGGTSMMFGVSSPGFASAWRIFGVDEGAGTAGKATQDALEWGEVGSLATAPLVSGGSNWG